jgi:hypothetical protein
MSSKSKNSTGNKSGKSGGGGGWNTIDIKNNLKDFARKIYSSKKISSGDKTRKAQKALFKSIHQSTFEQEVEVKKRALAAVFLRESADAITAPINSRSNEDVVVSASAFNKDKKEDSADSKSKTSPSAPGPAKETGRVAIAVDLDRKDKWKPDSRVQRSLFVYNIRQVVTKSILGWNAEQSKKLVFLRNGRAIHLFNMPFFNDIIHSEEESVSWKEFKVNVFYNYLSNMNTNISKIQAEIRAHKIIDHVFKELETETKSTKFTFRELKVRLERYSTLKAGDEFWKLECWDEKHEDGTSTLTEFVHKWLGGKNVDDLKSILLELEEEQRISVNDKSLIVTSSSANGDDNTKSLADDLNSTRSHHQQDFDDESDSEESDDNNDDSRSTKSGKSNRSVKSTKSTNSNKSSKSLKSEVNETNEAETKAEARTGEIDETETETEEAAENEAARRRASANERTKLFYTEVSNLKGAPKDLINLYPRARRALRIVLRKIISVSLVHAQSQNLSPLEVAKELYKNAQTLISKLKSEIEMKLSNENQHFRTVSHKYRKSKQRLADIETEYKHQQGILINKRKELDVDADKLLKLLRRNFRSRLINNNKSSLLGLKAIDAKEPKIWPLQPILNYRDQISQSIDQFTIIPATTTTTKPIQSSPQPPDSVDNEPDHLDYSSEFIVKDDSTKLGYVNGIISILEWNNFKRDKSLDSLSGEFLESLLKDYSKVEKTLEFESDKSSIIPLNLFDALDVVKNHGLVTTQQYNQFVARQDKNSSSSHAQILTNSTYNSIDKYLRIPSLRDLLAALIKYGPCVLITLPVYNFNTTKFWEKKDEIADTLLGYHTVAAVGYDKKTKQIKIMNSWGREYGNYGFSYISFAELFNIIQREIILLIDNSINKH